MGRCSRLALLTLTLALPGAPGAQAAEPAAALIAADDAYARDASQRGDWPATRAVALPQSEMFVPERVRMLEFGRERSDGEAAPRWRAEQAWLSCDGSIGVTFGRWTVPGTRLRGWYEFVWARQGDGRYRLYLRRFGGNARHLWARPGRTGQRAACSAARPPLPLRAPAIDTDFRLGASKDQTLIWTSAVTRAGAVTVTVALWNGTRHVPVLEDVAPAPAPR